ncbi:MAG: PQQ-dependent dehydrogenase, methanol/ethanol family [Pseudomonadota bacterium]
MKQIYRFCQILIIAIIAAPPCLANSGARIANEADGREWLSYGRTYSEQRFSPLNEINEQSVKDLGLAWSLPLEGERQLVSTPLIVDGVLYFTGSYSLVWAVDARTKKILWKYDPDTIGKAGETLRVLWGTSRGVAYWENKVFVGTGDGRLIAIDAKTGQELWSKQTVDPRQPYYITGAPRAFNGKILIGNGGAEFGAVRGYVTAYDAETGEEVWRWWTVPGNPLDGFENDAMKAAAETWNGEWWKHGGGGTVWNAMTYDPEFNVVYLGTGNGSPWNQRIRSPGGGDNLYLCSVVALDADTGEYKWHYQTTPGETWDFNSAMDIVLADLEQRDKTFKVILHAPKNGFFYIINRENGELLSAEKFAKVTWASKVDLKTGRPVEIVGARYEDGEETVWPGPLGAHNWQPMSYNPGTGLVYIPFTDMPGYYNDKKILPAEFDHSGFEFEVGVAGIQDDIPANIATSGLMGWNPVTQQAEWKSPNPGMWQGGTMTTAGNLVFQGRADGILVAHRADNGEELWRFDAGLGITAPPVTFELDGKQHVAVLVGWGGGVAALGGSMGAQHGWEYGKHPRHLLVFTLDGKAAPPAMPPPSFATPLIAPEFNLDKKQLIHGGEIFEKNCTWCHGGGAVSAGGAPDLRASPIVLDTNAMSTIVLEGALLSRGMPKFSNLERKDVEALQHFIRNKARLSIEAESAMVQ